MLSTAQLTSMRDAAALALPETGTVARRTMASDSAGGFTVTEASAGTVACRLDPVSNRDAILQTYAERIGSRPVFILNLDYGSNLVVGDEVTISAVSYEVIGILERSWEVTMQALVVVHA